MAETEIASVDAYVADCEPEAQVALAAIRAALREAVPDGEEIISYRIPALVRGGRPLVYYAAWKTHVSLYPVPAGDEAFEAKISQYRSGKSTLRFRLDRPIPDDVVRDVATRHVEQRRAHDGPPAGPGDAPPRLPPG